MTFLNRYCSFWALMLMAAVLLITPQLAFAQTISPQAREAFKQAMALNRSRQYAKALEYFLKAHQSDPSILSEDDQGLLPNATNYLKEQLAANPNDINHSFQLAELYSLRGRLDEALSCYRNVTSLNRNSPLANLADAEIARIEGMQQASAAATAAVAAAAPPPTAVTTTMKSADEKKLNDTIEILEERISDLEKMNEASREEAKAAQEDKEKLQKEFDELKTKAETWKLYYRLYMANPTNVQELRDRRSW